MAGQGRGQFMDATATNGAPLLSATAIARQADGHPHHLLAMWAPRAGHPVAPPPVTGALPPHANGPRHPGTAPVATHALRTGRGEGHGHSGVGPQRQGGIEIPPGNVGHPEPGHHLPGASQTPPRHAGGPAYPVKHRCSQIQDWQTVEWTTFRPQTAYLLQYMYGYLTQVHEGNNDYVRMNPAATEIIRQGVGVYATRTLRPGTNTPWATTERGAHIHSYQPTMPCRLPHPDNHNTIVFADASGTTSLTPAAGRAALELKVDGTGRLHQHDLRGATILGVSSHGELKTLAIVVDAVNDTQQEPREHAHHVWVVVDAAVDFQIVRRLAQQPLHKATDSSLGTQALHLWTALRHLPKHVVLHLVKQECHRYSLGNGHIDLHAHNQLAEHMPDGEDPPLQDHMHTHLQHLLPVPGPGEPPDWVADDRIHNNKGRAYHYPQPVRTMAHIQGNQADSALLSCLQHTLRTALYFSALDPSLIPVHLQTRSAELLLEQLPLLDRVARWYARRGIDIPPEYTICPCHLQQPETWEHFKRCPLA